MFQLEITEPIHFQIVVPSKPFLSIMSFATISVGFVATTIFVAVCYMGLSWGASKSTALWFPQTEGAPKSSSFFLNVFFMK